MLRVLIYYASSHSAGQIIPRFIDALHPLIATQSQVEPAIFITFIKNAHDHDLQRNSLHHNINNTLIL